jgi:hypothetical protein
VDALSQVEWTVAGKVIDQFSAELDGIVRDGTYVDTTAKGFLMHFTNAVVETLDNYREEEEKAWEMLESRKVE